MILSKTGMVINITSILSITIGSDLGDPIIFPDLPCPWVIRQSQPRIGYAYDPLSSVSNLLRATGGITAEVALYGLT